MVDRYIANHPDAVPMNISTPVPFKTPSSTGIGAATTTTTAAAAASNGGAAKAGSIFQRLGNAANGNFENIFRL